MNYGKLLDKIIRVVIVGIVLALVYWIGLLIISAIGKEVAVPSIVGTLWLILMLVLFAVEVWHTFVRGGDNFNG